MPIYDPQLLGVAACVCGRCADRKHCPRCGSYSTFGTAKVTQRVNPASGDTETFQVYKCRGCNLFYDDWQWRNECQAPQFSTARRRRLESAMHQVKSNVSDAEQAANALRERGASHDEVRRKYIEQLLRNVRNEKEDQS